MLKNTRFAKVTGWILVSLLMLSACQGPATPSLPPADIPTTDQPAPTQTTAGIIPTAQLENPPTSQATPGKGTGVEIPLPRLPVGLAPINTCPGAPPSRMQVGDQVYINQALTLNLRLREAPGLAASILSTNPAGTPFRVVGGPQCADQFTWWQLENQAGLTGWSAEGEANLMYLFPVGLLVYRDQYMDSQNRQMSKLTVLNTNGNLVQVAVDGFLGGWRLSVDGSSLFFAESNPQNYGIHVINLQNGERRKVNHDLALVINPSPDGKYLAYFDNTFTLKVLDLTSGQILYQNAYEDINQSSFAWSPDGKSIALLMDDLSILDIKTGQWRTISKIANRPERIPGIGISLLAWSPNSQQLVFSKDHGLYLINANGTGEMILNASTGNHLFPGWSPDGKEIVFIEQVEESSMVISPLKLLNLTNRKINTLVESMDAYSGVSWSGDGNYLLYVDLNRSVNIYNLANGSQKSITVFTQPGSTTFDPQWVTYR